MLFAFIALTLAGPAEAQSAAAPEAPTQPAAAAPAATTDCEFHVWPGDGLMSTYYGWFHGSTVNGQIMGRPGYPRVPPNPIDTATQAALLAGMEPHRLMRQPDHRLVVHDTALESRTIRTTQGRLTDSASTCYAELIVDDVVLQQDFLNGSYLKVLFRYRNFGADALPLRSFATWAQTHLDIFPPEEPEQLDAAIAEIRGAYRQDIATFAAAALRPPRARRR